MKKSFLLSLSLFFILSCHLAPYPPPPLDLPAPVLPPGGPNGDPIDLNNEGSQINVPTVGDPARTRTNELPYNLIPDFLSALTCSNSTSFGSGFYTLSLSSRYEGLQLADSFKRVHQLNSRNGRGQISQNERNRILQALRNSPLRNTHAELSVRNRGDIYSSAQINGRPLTGYYFPSFNTDWVFNQLSLYIQVLSTRPINRSRYNSSPFRTSLSGLNNRDFVQTIAPNLSQSAGNYMLALTYTVPQQNNKNQLLADENRRPYGKSYTLNFNSGANIDYLTDVYEEDFLSSRRGEGWSCPPNLKFLIHKNSSERNSQYNRDATNRYSHLGLKELELEGYCDLNDRSPLTKEQKDFLSLEFGRDEKSWPFRAGISVVARDGGYVRLADTPCLVISRGSSCYPQSGFYRVEFDPRWVDNCKRIHDFSSSDRDYHNIENAGVYRVCPAWLSMCYRNESN